MSNYSPQLPLQVDATNGFANNQTILRVVLQNLKMLLLTSPGERIMDPNFGVGMRRFLFEQNNIDTHSRVAGRIRVQVKEYMSYVEITDIKFESELNNKNVRTNALLVRISFYITATSTPGTLELSI